MRLSWLKSTVAIVVLTIGSAANAVTIGFDPLVGANGDAYFGHSEVGFDITSDIGSWQEGHVAGNPTPSIFTNSSVASILVGLSGGGLFTFDSVDFNDGNNSGSTDYSIIGSLGGLEIFSIMGDVPLEFGSPIASISSASIDSLFIELTLNQSSSANIDNIIVNAVVPEPATLALMGLGLTGFGYRRKTR